MVLNERLRGHQSYDSSERVRYFTQNTKCEPEVVLKEMSGIIKVIRLHCLGIKDDFTKLNGNLSNSCWDIPAWTKAVTNTWANNTAIPRAMHSIAKTLKPLLVCSYFKIFNIIGSNSFMRATYSVYAHRIPPLLPHWTVQLVELVQLSIFVQDET